MLGKGGTTSSASHKKLSGKQKAAIFLVVIGPEASSQIFNYLKDIEIEDLTFEIARLDKIEPVDKEAILVEFQELLQAQEFIISGGIDAAKNMLEKAMGTQKAADVINRLTTSIQRRPFEGLRKVDIMQIVNFIQSEHPQTISLILSYLDPLKAANVLSSLPQEVQPDVARRMAIMDRTSPEVLKEVESVLNRKIQALGAEDYASAGGIDTIVEILNLSDRGTERKIIEELDEQDAELAEEIKKRMFVFEDIILLDDRSIQKVLREVDSSDLSKALKAVDEEVQDKVYRNMSRRAAATLREDIDFMGPVRVKDVEEAQQKIVSVIRKLEEAGDVVISRPGEEEVIV